MSSTSNPTPQLSTTTTKKVIVFGSTGAIGRHLIAVMSQQAHNWDIVAVTRSASTDKFSQFPKVQVAQGDASDKDAVLELCKGMDIVYSCIGFPKYETKYWAKQWPIVVDNLLEATKLNKGQKLIFCDNLYAYGATTNISPDQTSMVPPSTKSKPAIRSMLRQKFQERMKEAPNSIVVVGGADFFGPYVTSSSFLGDTFTKAIVEGKPAPICVGSNSVIHDFCFAPDFAKALYVVALDDKANGKFWICPHTVHNKTLSEIAKDMSKLCGPNTTNSKVTAYPGWSVRLLSPFVGFMWEMVEMLPFWSNDYTVDDSDFIQTFGVQATPYEEALQAYIDFYKGMAEK